MPKENTAWFTPTEIALRLKVNQVTVRRWLRDGSLRGSFLGRVWRIGDADLAAFMEAAVPVPGAELPDDEDDQADDLDRLADKLNSEGNG